MFTLAHLSDLHLALTPKLSELASKRGLGYINWQRKRKYIHRPDLLTAITRDLQARSAEHIAVTGDLTNFSLPGEYAWARRWLESIGRPTDVTVIPGTMMFMFAAQRNCLANSGAITCAAMTGSSDFLLSAAVPTWR